MGLELVHLLLYAILALLGFIFQSVLHGSVRIMIYPLSFALGVLVGNYSIYHALFFNIGMIGRAAVGGYWSCVVVELACLLAGILVGIYLI